MRGSAKPRLEVIPAAETANEPPPRPQVWLIPTDGDPAHYFRLEFWHPPTVEEFELIIDLMKLAKKGLLSATRNPPPAEPNDETRLAGRTEER